MISFFRKIRQNLLQHNQVSRYLIYALGEIILVVIGILIALQVNNWKDERKEEKEILNYIQSIKKDIEADISLFDQIINSLNEQVISGNYIVPIMESENPIIQDSLTFILRFNEMTTANIITKQNTTWDYVNSSGLISRMVDPKLNELLQQYYRRLNSLIENYNQSAIPPRLEIRRLKYELFEDREHRKFFPTNNPIAPGKQVYSALLEDDRILPLCRFIGGGSAVYYERSFQNINTVAQDVLRYLEENYPQ